MTCPRCSSIINAHRCVNCGWTPSDATIDEAQAARDRVAAALRHHKRGDLAALLETGAEVIDRSTAEAVASEAARQAFQDGIHAAIGVLRSQRPDISELLDTGKTVAEVIAAGRAAQQDSGAAHHGAVPPDHAEAPEAPPAG